MEISRDTRASSNNATNQASPWRTLFGLAAFAVLFVLAMAGQALAHDFSYTIETRGDIESDVDTFAAITDEALNDIRGWSLNYNVTYGRVQSGQDFRVILASPEEVDRASSACSPQWSCRVGNQILINDERWQNTTSTWPLGRPAYRRYVVNHEVGHWLGLGHPDCPGEGRDAPVMMQQSKGLKGCNARVWPKFWERNRVADIQNVDGWPMPPYDAPCTIERRSSRRPAARLGRERSVRWPEGLRQMRRDCRQQHLPELPRRALTT